MTLTGEAIDEVLFPSGLAGLWLNGLSSFRACLAPLTRLQRLYIDTNRWNAGWFDLSSRTSHTANDTPTTRLLTSIVGYCVRLHSGLDMTPFSRLTSLGVALMPGFFVPVPAHPTRLVVEGCVESAWNTISNVALESFESQTILVPRKTLAVLPKTLRSFTRALDPLQLVNGLGELFPLLSVSPWTGCFPRLTVAPLEASLNPHRDVVFFSPQTGE